MTEILDHFFSFGVIPVVAIEDATQAPALGDALIAGGLPCAEITFRTKAAEAAIRTLARTKPEILVGAGTVLNNKQAQVAIEAGAEFLVTPGFDAYIVEHCLRLGVTIIPGVATPTEINMALKLGLDTLKFFPAEALGGVKTLKAICSPYADIRFIPTGGVNQNNLLSYLEMPQVVACGGSWLVKKQLITDGEFEKIVSLVQEAVHLVEGIRR
jgi:2-dehydro-3-deoxyphosphogluconate aldolase/(4S)-4-hydroxy-2-oxoglutarate aldolase